MSGLDRRGLVAGALALAACEGRAQPQPAMVTPTDIEITPLKAAAPFPMGVCAQVKHLDDPAWVALAGTHFSQLTPEWEMKMEYIVQPDGSFRFDRPDRLAKFARDHGMRLYGTSLVWYAQRPEGFVRLDENRASFGQAYDNYIAAVVGRYRGQAAGWDVVNEPIAEDGNGLRDSLWSQRLGDFDHMRRAFDAAHAADPEAVLFVNDYNLETLPRKLDSYRRLIERLLQAKVPLGGIGCQSHLAADVRLDAIPRTLEALAQFGLPIHLSELDVSIVRSREYSTRWAERTFAQGGVYTIAMESFLALPPRQRFALTLWGLRDSDSWLRGENIVDAPALFDNLGRPKPAILGFANRIGALKQYRVGGRLLKGNEAPLR